MTTRWNRPVFAVAALYIAAEKNKHVVKPPERNQLLKAGDVQDSEFKRIYDDMKRLALEEAKASAAASAAAAAAAKQQEAAQKEAELLKREPIFGGKTCDGEGQSTKRDELKDTRVEECGRHEEVASASLQTCGNYTSSSEVTGPADGSCGGFDGASGKHGKHVQEKVRDVATPSGAGTQARAGARMDAKSAVSTVRKAEARRPAPSAAQRLSNLCSIGMKRKVALSAQAVEKETPAGLKCAHIESLPCATASETWQFVANDGKAHAGSKKRQRKEEMEAEKARKKELKTQEYVKWRESQIAQFQHSQSAAVSSAAAECADTPSAGPCEKPMANACEDPSRSGECADVSGPLKDGTRKPNSQTTLFDFIRQKQTPPAGASGPCGSIAQDGLCRAPVPSEH